MKKLMPVLALAGTVLVVSAGLILPETVASMQDQLMHKETVSYKMEQMGFRSASHLKDSLQLVGQKYTHVDLKKGNIFSGEGIWQLAEEMLKQLNENGMTAADPGKYTHHEEKPFLGITPDNSLTAVLWQCRVWNDSGESAVMVLDDNSGAVIAVDIRPTELILAYDSYGIIFEEEAYNWINSITEIFGKQMKMEKREFLTDSYAVQDHSAVSDSTEYTRLKYLEGCVGFSGGEQEEIVYLPIYFSEERLTIGNVNLADGMQ